MTDNEKALFHHFEMASHSEGYAQFLYQLMGGGFITKDQAKETMEFFKARMKCNIESNPNLTREQKDNDIATREAWFNALSKSIGLI